MTKALLVIDVQNDYFTGGNQELVGMEYAASNVRRVLEHFRTANLPVFHVQHLAVQDGANFFVPHTKGCEINEEVQPNETEIVVTKNYPNSFRDTGLDEALKKAGITELVVVGAMTHMCIDTTVRAAFDLGYVNTVLSDACATRALDFKGWHIRAADVHVAFLAALQVPFATVITTSEYLNAA
ncbi:Streptothricin hydrolase [Andreprevotia sp. IGB-42]|uniref:cysteine hydrolase family protein n=1 Tax=Andreprevotia sp. IGB-42 TaxID=2497473 RepID=UPI00135949B6|nr:cysteine hydrolase family protein [Andreprevotia sp. IGB-42]KAF0814285.1 Streptothricin hydrolase [Andreprevotia sp. IGB-42]